MRKWRAAYWVLFAIFMTTAALNMTKVHAGFLTNYASDLFVPPWLYIVVRRLAHRGQSVSLLHRWFGPTPERAAIGLFIASAATEVSQIYWPHGVFRGVFDPFDLLAYAVGLGACYIFERRPA